MRTYESVGYIYLDFFVVVAIMQTIFSSEDVLDTVKQQLI